MRRQNYRRRYAAALVLLMSALCSVSCENPVTAGNSNLVFHPTQRHFHIDRETQAGLGIVSTVIRNIGPDTVDVQFSCFINEWLQVYRDGAWIMALPPIFNLDCEGDWLTLKPGQAANHGFAVWSDYQLPPGLYRIVARFGRFSRGGWGEVYSSGFILTSDEYK